MKLRTLILIVFLLVSCFFKTIAQENQKTLFLVSGNKSKKIKFNNALTIFSPDGETAGGFRYADANSLFLSPYYQKDKNGKIKFFSGKTDSIIKIDFNSITRIEKERSTLGSIAAVTCWVAAGSALIVSPLLSIEKGGKFDTKKCLTISGISLGTGVLSAAVIALFSSKMFYLTSNVKHRRIWKIKT